MHSRRSSLVKGETGVQVVSHLRRPVVVVKTLACNHYKERPWVQISSQGTLYVDPFRRSGRRVFFSSSGYSDSPSPPQYEITSMWKHFPAKVTNYPTPLPLPRNTNVERGCVISCRNSRLKKAVEKLVLLALTIVNVERLLADSNLTVCG